MNQAGIAQQCVVVVVVVLPFRARHSFQTNTIAASIHLYDMLILFQLLLFQKLVYSQFLCYQPFVPENAHVIFNEPGPYPEGTIAKYSCALGFDLIGARERTCLPGGKWSDDSPICAIDVARNKPSLISTGSSGKLCSMSNDESNSYWQVDLLGEYSIRHISLSLGHQSSIIDSIELIQSSGAVQRCPTRLLVSNSTSSFYCSYDNVTNIRVTAQQRLHLCNFSAYAINAVSYWQCAQSEMDIISVINGLCYSASREEQTDWLGAQKACLDRGGTLPLRIDEQTRNGIRQALGAHKSTKAFYWIGASSSLNEWRWVDGETIGSYTDWPSNATPTPEPTEAVLIARPLGWRWVPASKTAWNAFMCQSKPKFCTSPGVGDATKVSFSSTSYAIGTKCYYTCDKGYNLQGDSVRECSANGRWTGSIPNCTKVSCGGLNFWSQGTVNLLNSSTNYLDIAEYVCAIGSKLPNMASSYIRTCESNGTWSGHIPQCETIDCGDPPNIDNGYAVFNSTTYQSTTFYSCKDGFRLIGSANLTCSSKGEWQPSMPFCYDISSLHEFKLSDGQSTSNNLSSTNDGSIALAVLSVIMVICLIVFIFKMSNNKTSKPLSTSQDKLNNSIYATPSIPAQRPDSVIYYAPTVAHMEVPPNMLHIQQLPNGNIHVTLPIGRQLQRAALPQFSPSQSEMLYSFDDEPIYDVPPDCY